MGAADVLLPVVTGQTWMEVPETVLIDFRGDKPFGIMGKVRVCFYFCDVNVLPIQQFRCLQEYSISWQKNTAESWGAPVIRSLCLMDNFCFDNHVQKAVNQTELKPFFANFSPRIFSRT